MENVADGAPSLGANVLSDEVLDLSVVEGGAGAMMDQASFTEEILRSERSIIYKKKGNHSQV